MSEHPGHEFAPLSSGSQISPSMPSLVLFIISMPVTITSEQWRTLHEILGGGRVPGAS